MKHCLLPVGQRSRLLASCWVCRFSMAWTPSVRRQPVAPGSRYAVRRRLCVEQSRARLVGGGGGGRIHDRPPHPPGSPGGRRHRRHGRQGVAPGAVHDRRLLFGHFSSRSFLVVRCCWVFLTAFCRRGYLRRGEPSPSASRRTLRPSLSPCSGHAARVPGPQGEVRFGAWGGAVAARARSWRHGGPARTVVGTCPIIDRMTRLSAGRLYCAPTSARPPRSFPAGGRPWRPADEQPPVSKIGLFISRIPLRNLIFLLLLGSGLIPLLAASTSSPGATSTSSRPSDFLTRSAEALSERSTPRCRRSSARCASSAKGSSRCRARAP